MTDIPDEAVEAGARAVYGIWAELSPDGRDIAMHIAHNVLEAAAPVLLPAERERIAQAIEALSELKLRDYPGSGPHVSKWAAVSIARNPEEQP